MKTFAALILACLIGFTMFICGVFIDSKVESKEVTVTYSGMSINKQNLIDYNVIVMTDKKEPVCGGTVIESGKKTKVLTALHCVDTKDNRVIPYGFIKINKDIYRVHVVKYSRAQDLALLVADDPIGDIPAARLGAGVEAGEAVWIIGFGAGQEDILSHGTVALPDAVSRWSGTHVTVIDGSGYYGNSGGGIFNENDELVGVLIEIGPSGTPGLWVYAVHPSEIIKLLN